MNPNLLSLIVTIISCGTLVGGLVYLDYWFKKKDKERERKKLG